MNITLPNQTTINLLKRHEFACTCGQNHCMNIDEIVIGSCMLERIPEIVRKHDLGDRVLVVMDQMIFNLYGQKIEETLRSAEFAVTMNVFTEKAVLPNEMALAKMLITMEPGTEWILAVGSGAINDLCRYMSYKLGIPYVSVPTAASMDGYTADSALLLLNGLKQTRKATYPKLVIGDTGVLSGTPQILLAAGFGDLAAKITAGADWELGHLVTGVDYCECVEKIIMDAVDRSIADADALSRREMEAAGTLLQGLLITGFPMHWTGMSQPVAGAEHHLTHFWGMKAVAEGRHPHLHGIEVALGIVIVMQVFREFLEKDFSGVDIDAVVKAQIDKEAWRQEIAEHYGASAESVYAENAEMAFDEESVRAEVIYLVEHMDELKACVQKHLRPYEGIAEILKKVGCITSPAELGFTKEQVKESLCYAHYNRKKYTILRMLSRLGCLEEVAENVANRFYA